MAGLRANLVHGTAILATGALALPAGEAWATDQRAPRLTLVSHGARDRLGDGGSWAPVLSGDGGTVGFASRATNLPAGGGADRSQVFVWTRRGGRFVRAGGTRRGTPVVGAADAPALSRTGRYVVFTAGDPAGRVTHVYRFDRATGRVLLVDRGTGGRPGNGPATAPVVSASGRFVAFVSDATDLTKPRRRDTVVPRVYVRDLRRNRTRPVPVPGGWRSTAPSLSADGRVVAFRAAPVDAGAVGSVFVADLRTGRASPVPVTPGLGPGGVVVGPPHLSPSGRFVAFDAVTVGEGAAAPSRIYLHDLRTGRTRRVDIRPFGPGVPVTSRVADVSYDARYLAFDSSPKLGLAFPMRSSAFVLDRRTHRVRRIAGIAPTVTEASVHDLSWDGRYATVELAEVVGRGRTTRTEVYLARLAPSSRRVSVSSGRGRAALPRRFADLP